MNQIGDRYSCSDPNCGCEIEIERPCEMLSSETKVADISSGSERVRRRDFRSEPHADPSDYGSQGATGEGTFGTTGTGDRNATTSGRYDTEHTRVTEDSRPSGPTLTCFCGQPMRQIGSGRRALAASFPKT